VAEERERRQSLVPLHRRAERRIGRERIDTEIGPLVVKATIERCRDSRAVRLDEDDAAAGPEHPARLVEEARGVAEMMEHVDEDEVRERGVRVRQLVRVDDRVRPARRLDVRGDDIRHDVLELREPRPELDRLARAGRELARDLLVPLPVEAPQDRPLAPGSLLVRERGLEAHRRSPAKVT